RVAGELDRYAERLRVQRIAACRATVDDTPARGIDAACLDDQLDSLAAVAHALADPPSAEVLDRADQVAATLVDCAHRPASAITPPRIDQRAAVATIAGAFAEAEVQGHRGDYAGALGKLRPVIAQARALGYPPSLGRVLAAAGHLELALGDAHAEADLREAAEVAAGARDDQTAVRAWIDLLALAGKQGDRPDRYETTLVAARAAAARSGDPDERAALDLEHGRAMNQASKFADADASCRQALELAGKLHGEGSLDVRPALACLGKAAEGRGDYAQSRQWLDRALAIDRAILGDQHPDTADDLQVECELLLRTGKFDEGLAACRAALAVREHVFGAQSDQVARTEKTIGDVLVDGGHTTDALPHLQRAIDIAEHNHGPEAPALASALASLGSADHDLGKAEPAVALFRRAIAIYEKTGDESDLGITLINLTDVLITMKHYPDALASAQRAQAALEHSMGASSPIVGFALYDVARCQTALGRPADAIPPLERAISLTDPNSNDPDNLASYQFALAQALWDSHGDRARARELARTSFATLTEIGDAVKGPRAEVGAWLATHR
ncbi:MAG TPA: tetratricopeptide repeat protein, partial [Kofleriaceae bacterium]|nr:tetratricopeptide repeat protein [Kofleriaceae bacterium]